MPIRQKKRLTKQPANTHKGRNKNRPTWKEYHKN
nr:MAG TPA: hypothetical protein [Caudoviricetes sp.]